MVAAENRFVVPLRKPDIEDRWIIINNNTSKLINKFLVHHRFVSEKNEDNAKTIILVSFTFSCFVFDFYLS